MAVFDDVPSKGLSPLAIWLYLITTPQNLHASLPRLSLLHIPLSLHFSLLWLCS